MITTIIELFRTQARAHKAIRSFYYNRNYELGSGKDNYPLFWFEDPINGRNENHTFTNTVNFAILFIPNDTQSVEEAQNLAFSVGLNIIERIKASPESLISILANWSYTSLRNYYDDNASGCRFSVNFTQQNMQNLCLIEEQFDRNKEFEKNETLKDFAIDPANNCEVFVNKFPVFDLKTSKQ